MSSLITSSTPDPSLQGSYRVLVIDDSPDNLFLVQTLLEDDGYEVILAESGEAALALLEQVLPDIILLDMMMPGMDGYEVTRRIRQNPKLAFIPILLVTAHRKVNIVEGLHAGADDFIRKPIDLDDLLVRVRTMLQLKHKREIEQNSIAVAAPSHSTLLASQLASQTT